MQKNPTIRFLDRSTPPSVFTLVFLAGMSAMVMNMFLPSLPAMTSYFNTDYRLMQLSVTVYLAVSGVLQVFIGPISDNLGRRPVLLAGIAVFMATTLGCIFASSIEMFLVFRMLQAAIAVSMVLSRAVVRDLYDQDQAASVLGFVTMFMSVVPMFSPAVGGVLEEYFGWKSVFWTFLAIGGIGFLLVFFDLGETAVSSGKSLVQQFKEYPELLRSPRFWGYSLAAAFCSGAFFAYLGGAPYVGSEVFGLSPTALGLLFGAPAFGYMFGNFLTSRLAMTHGANRLVLWGCISNFAGVTISLTLFALGFGTITSFFGLMTLVGIGNGLVIPNATAGMLSVRPHLAGTASGLGGAMMVGGGAALSALPGMFQSPETGAFPLLIVMCCTGICALISISVVYVREKRLNT